MGQFILFILGLFAIGCVLYGISAGVQSIQRGFSWFAESARDSTSNKKPLITPRKLGREKSIDTPTTQRKATQPEVKGSTPPTKVSRMQRSIDELWDIFSLYQQGALTQEEFESIKRGLLSGIDATALPNQ